MFQAMGHMCKGPVVSWNGGEVSVDGVWLGGAPSD
jgi:hypothetical protein